MHADKNGLSSREKVSGNMTTRVHELCHGSGVTTQIPVQSGAVVGTGQDACSFAASQVTVFAPVSMNPSLQLNVATLPC